MKSKAKPLSITHPNIAKQAYGWDPSMVTHGEGKKRAWQCDLGHIWDAAPNTRVVWKSGCSICANVTILKGYNDLKTVYPDIAKEAFGWDPQTVGAGTHAKKNWKCKKGHIFEQSVSSRTSSRKTGCPYCASQKVLHGYNDISTTHPKLAREANDWDPKTVMAGSHIKRNWKCKKGHNWSASPKQRTNIREGRKGNNCPICANRVVLKGYNDLATTHPRIAREANGWDPRTITAGNGSRRNWRCQKGHVTQVSAISKTARDSNCRVCTNQQLQIGFNDLATTHPELAAQANGWDPTKVISGAKQKLSWKCSKGHIWLSIVSNRKTGFGCPSCSQGGFDPNLDGYVYFMRHPKWKMLQIGITNFPKERMRTHKQLGWELIKRSYAMEGHVANDWERMILKMLKAHGAKLGNQKSKSKFDGYTESWLTKSYPATSLRELMDEAEKYSSRKSRK